MQTKELWSFALGVHGTQYVDTLGTGMKQTH